MEFYTAWHGLVSGQAFIWYLILAGLIIIQFFNKLLIGYKEFIGHDIIDLTAGLAHFSQQQLQSEKSKLARWRLDLQNIIIELKHDRKWAGEATGELLMVKASLKALSYLKSLVLPSDDAIVSVQQLHEWINQHHAFFQVTGAQAQSIANKSQLALAISLSQTDDLPNTAALIIPGEIYPGSVLGKDNPMVLWFGHDMVMEMQAAAAFSHKQPVHFFAVKNEE